MAGREIPELVQYCRFSVSSMDSAQLHDKVVDAYNPYYGYFDERYDVLQKLGQKNGAKKKEDKPDKSEKKESKKSDKGEKKESKKSDKAELKKESKKADKDEKESKKADKDKKASPKVDEGEKEVEKLEVKRTIKREVGGTKEGIFKDDHDQYEASNFEQGKEEEDEEKGKEFNIIVAIIEARMI
ncbi:unnamed protein product [Gongylonema pulchrum]|uniref:Glutamic acid-rich protein-like n=1 Tax=Gongylonema pulchrum TaxID=637853 RepID=A0A183E6Q0_9BILA|nr:unnamed protein product [Gongylonema pulchrum]